MKSNVKNAYPRCQCHHGKWSHRDGVDQCSSQQRYGDKRWRVREPVPCDCEHYKPPRTDQ